VLVLHDKMAHGHFIVCRLNQENPELLHLQEALFQIGEKGLFDLIKDKLVLLGCTVEGQHCAPIVVLFPENVVARQSSCLLVFSSVGE